MTTGINTRLAVMDALGWPIGIAIFLVVASDFEVGGAHGMAFLFLGIWAIRKLNWALDGYREEDWFVNPTNPVSVLLAVFLRQEGWYSYTTTTVLVWFGSIFAFCCLIRPFL
ncbi:hypothetical protein [Azohydromonas australica]|uniref:hypothetical protein n=1 Tax=Azohydromonas australica TaxID=364039 RepID=UPI00040E3FFC|nr:hypothetical protein [Azohydromonas australica]